LREIVAIAGDEPDGLRAIGAEQGGANDRGSQRSDVTAIYYTSGTTGMPKGCMIDHEYWLRACDVLHRLNRPAEGFAQLCCIPFYHVDAVGQLVVSLQSAGTIVYMRRFSASRFWAVARAHDVSEIFLVASMPILLLKQERDPRDRDHRISTAVCAAMPPQLHREFCKRFGIILLEGYGSTEAGWLSRVPKAFGEAMIGSGSIGAAMPEVEYRIVDDTGRDVGEDKPGELMVKAPGLFRGYVNDPAATAAVLRDGWYSTGDIVSRDDRGFLYFRGRRKMIPLVLDAAVIAVPDEIRGEEALAYVILTPGAAVASLPPEAIASHCAQHLTFFKVPRYIAYWTGDFPRTPTMRVQKGALSGTGLAIWDRMTSAWTGQVRQNLSA
jgi:crotonobetaine/carnitine-CoA ligase